jgi:hypothetical protein
MAYPSDELERLEYWRRQIKYAEDLMEPIWRVSETLEKMYINEASSDSERLLEDLNAEDSEHLARIKTNLIFGWIDQSIANLLERNPSFLVTPRTRNSVGGVDAVKSISDYWYRETEQLSQDERILLDSFLGPYGVKKLGWTIDELSRKEDIVNPEGIEYDEPEQEVIAVLSGEMPKISRDQDHEMFLEVYTELMQQPLFEVEEEIEALMKEVMKIHRSFMDQIDPDVNSTQQWEAPYGLRWNPKDFLVDPLAQDGLRDARWIAFRFKRPVDDIKSNTSYGDTEGLEPTARMIGAPEKRTGIDDDFGLVEGWEIWARSFAVSGKRRKNMLITLAVGHDKFLQHEEEWPLPELDDYPAEVLSMNQTMDTWFSKPALLLAGADNLQGMTNEILNSYLHVIRKQKNLLLYDPDHIDDDEVENMLAAPDMTAIPVRGLAEHGSRLMFPLSFGDINQDGGALLGQIRNLFDESAGTPQPQQRGIETATEASITERRTSAREARRGNLLSKMQINTARKFWQMTVFFRPDRAFLIDPTAELWMNVDEKIARGEYRFTMDVASQANAISLERKNWLDLLNLFAGLTGLWKQEYGAAPNLPAIAAKLLSRGYNIPNPEDLVPGVTSGGSGGSSIIDQLLEGNNRNPAMSAMPQGEGDFTQAGGRALPDPNNPDPAEVEQFAEGSAALPRQFNRPPADQGGQAATAQ